MVLGSFKSLDLKIVADMARKFYTEILRFSKKKLIFVKGNSFEKKYFTIRRKINCKVLSNDPKSQSSAKLVKLIGEQYPNNILDKTIIRLNDSPSLVAGLLNTFGMGPAADLSLESDEICLRNFIAI